MLPEIYAYMTPEPTPEQKAQFKKLWELCEQMGNVPKHRFQDIHWLLRNLQIKNSQHPLFQETRDLLKKMLTGDV